MSTSTNPASSSIQDPVALPTRRPYHGSCHCGHTRYIAYLTLPPITNIPKPPGDTTIRIRKCNCTTCHRMSFFHLWLQSSPDDFIVLSPQNPITGGLVDYMCYDKTIHFYFCGRCGVRCFALTGEGEVKVAEVEGEKREVWMLRKEGWVEDESGRCYFSVNAAALEQGQEGLDLKEWTEKGWIAYLDCRDNVGKTRYREPHTGGMY